MIPKTGQWLTLRTAAIVVIIWATLWLQPRHVRADGAPATLLPPARVAGSSGHGDERNADVYPAVAYDLATSRYLAVWMSLRNAASSSDGFDVYGIFLDRAGRPIGSEFRISDSNTAARSSFPSVATGDGEFVVAWTTRGGACEVRVQRVIDASQLPDRVLLAGAVHRHSPNLIYNPTRREYVLAYAEGDDYMPPTLFGAQMANCGDSAASTGRIRAVAFGLTGGMPAIRTSVDVSDVQAGAFRPRLAYSARLNQYIVAWEDRRGAGGVAGRFDVYAQKLAGDLSAIGGDVSLATGDDYTNYDTSATWTPRPAVAGSDDGFLVVWFSHRLQDGAHLWSVNGHLLPSGNLPGTPFAVARMTFAQPHDGRAPTGYLAAAFLAPANEYLIGMSSHVESIWGYLSFALVQRVTPQAQLLRLDGTVRSQPGIGNSIDYANDDQIGIGLATDPLGGVGTADYLAIYSKHAPGQPSTDFDVWDARVRMPAPGIKGSYLPLVIRSTG